MSTEDDNTVEINLSKSGNKSLVKKANRFNEARYKTTLIGQRIVLSIISQIRMEDEDLKKYRLKIKDFADFFKLKSNRIYKEVSETSEKLQMTPITIQEEKGKIVYAWFIKTYHDNEGRYIDYEFHPDLKPYLIQLRENFVRYGLSHIIKLKSNHSIRIYELLKQYENLGSRSFEIEKLKEILGLENQYDIWANFKERVINKAKEEINEKTDIVINYETVREYRKISEIQFTVHTKKVSESNEKGVPELIELVREEHRNEKVLKKLVSFWYNNKGFKHVKYSILYVNAKQTKNYMGYLTECLKKDWGTNAEIDERIERLRKEKEKW